MILYARLAVDELFSYHYSLLSVAVLILREHVTISINMLPDESSCRIVLDVIEPEEQGAKCQALLQWLAQQMSGDLIMEEDAG